MFAPSSRSFRLLMATAGCLLMTSAAQAAITVTGPVSPAIPPAGVGQSYASPGELVIGVGGFGSLPAVVTVDATSELSAESFTIGQTLGSIGQLSVSDRGAKLVGRSAGLTVGAEGDGWVTASNGALLDFSQATATVTLGAQATGAGRLAVSDSGTALVAGFELQVGPVGYGEVELTDGAVASVGLDLDLGDNETGSGIVSIDGHGSRAIVGRNVSIGNLGYGEAYVSGGGWLRVGNALNIGGISGVGVLDVQGQQSRVSVAGNLNVGPFRGRGTDDAGGVLAIRDNAVVDADQSPQSAVQVQRDGRVELSGGTLLANSVSLQGTLSGDGVVGGTVSGFFGSSIDVGEAQTLELLTLFDTNLASDILLAGGRFDLNGRLLHNTGDITLRDGAVLDATETITTSVFSATSGVSDVYGNTSVEGLVIAQDTTLVFHDNITFTTSTLQPGASLVTLADLSMIDPMGSMSLALGGQDADAAVVVAGQMTLAGSLAVNASAEVEASAAVGDVFTLIEADSFSGGFDRIDLPTLSGNRWLSPTVSADSVIVTVVDLLPGDFNLDGNVDAADYSVLRDGLGTIYDESDLLAWTAFYGATTGPAVSVPEPTAAAVLLGLLAVAGLRRTA